MERRPRPDQNEITQECFGISETTLEVVSVSVTRGGRATRYARDMTPYSVELGGDSTYEVALNFKLFDVQCVATVLAHGASGKAIRAELEKKAAALRAKRAASGETGNGGAG